MLCLLPLLYVACSTNVAGTTEETNALADKGDVEVDTTVTDVSSSSVEQLISSSSIDDVTSISSSNEPAGASSSSAVGIPDSATTVITDPVEPNVMHSRYWRPYWVDEDDKHMTNVNVEVDEGEEISVSYEVYMPLGGSETSVSNFGIEIRVDGDGDDVFSEMKTWTGGACYMVTSEVPIVLKIGMSPEKERELEYDLPQATLIEAKDVGNLVLRCLSWLDFEQQGFGPTITIEEAFFDYMTSLRFEVPFDTKYYKGSFEIHQIRAGGTGISANTDGMNISVDDGTENIEQPDGN